MGTVLIVQDYECIEMYGLGLIPWKHYIPVDYWFLNLTDAVVWAETHPSEVKAMLAAQHKYAEEVLTQDAVQQYTRILMQRYSKLMEYNTKQREGAVPVNSSFL